MARKMNEDKYDHYDDPIFQLQVKTIESFLFNNVDGVRMLENDPSILRDSTTLQGMVRLLPSQPDREVGVCIVHIQHSIEEKQTFKLEEYLAKFQTKAY